METALRGRDARYFVRRSAYARIRTHRVAAPKGVSPTAARKRRAGAPAALRVLLFRALAAELLELGEHRLDVELLLLLRFGLRLGRRFRRGRGGGKQGRAVVL